MKPVYSFFLLFIPSTFASNNSTTHTATLPYPTVAEYGFGPVLWPGPARVSKDPSLTKSVPFMFQDETWTLRVNLSEYAVSDADTDLTNPRIVFFTYDLSWPGDKNLNDSIAAAENLAKDEKPYLWLTHSMGLFTAHETNAYHDDGDCRPILGDACVTALEAPFTGDLDTESFSPPDSDKCKKTTLYSAGAGSGPATLPTLNEEKKYNVSVDAYDEPYTIGWWTSGLFGNLSTTPYQRESNALHMIILTSTTKSYPLCVRLERDHIKPGSVSSGVSSRPNTWVAAVLALGVLMFVL